MEGFKSTAQRYNLKKPCFQTFLQTYFQGTKGYAHEEFAKCEAGFFNGITFRSEPLDLSQIKALPQIKMTLVEMTSNFSVNIFLSK